MSLKRSIIGLLAAGLVLIAGGCRMLPDMTDSQPSAAPDIDYAKYESQYLDNWQYQYLTVPEKSNYGALYTVLMDGFDRDETVSINAEDGSGSREYTGVPVPLPHPLHTQEQARRLYNAFFRDNPQFFYVSNLYGLEGYMDGETPCYDTLVLVYTMTKIQRATATQRLEDAVTELLRDRPETDDEYLTELYLHDRLAERCTYDNAAAKDGNEIYPNAFTAYGALIDGRAVCEGYSRAMQLLLDRTGIDCTLVIGSSRETGEEHMWNLVTVNGRNYHLDVTWNDSEDQPSHAYMNMTTDQLLKSHTIETGQSGIDTCSATQDDYFVRAGTYVDTYHRQDIADQIAAVILSGATTVELRFQPDKYDNGLLFLKNQTLTFQMVNASLAAAGRSDMTMWEYRLLGRSDEHILTLVKE